MCKSYEICTSNHQTNVIWTKLDEIPRSTFKVTKVQPLSLVQLDMCSCPSAQDLKCSKRAALAGSLEESVLHMVKKCNVSNNSW